MNNLSRGVVASPGLEFFRSQDRYLSGNIKHPAFVQKVKLDDPKVPSNPMVSMI